VVGPRHLTLGVRDALTHVKGERNEWNRNHERQRAEIMSDRKRTLGTGVPTSHGSNAPIVRINRSIPVAALFVMEMQLRYQTVALVTSALR
jgi:hypothetical protein